MPTLGEQLIDLRQNYVEDSKALLAEYLEKEAILFQLMDAEAAKNNTPPVLVRTSSGPAVTIYHSSLESFRCNRIVDLLSYKKVTESVAIADGLTRCGACRWSGYPYQDSGENNDG